jgi:hypothetical protein
MIMENGKVRIHDGHFLYTKDAKVFYRGEDGTIRAVPQNRFEHGDIVRTTDKHFSNHDFTMLENPVWTSTRGWVYSQRYIGTDGSCGGGSSAWEEGDFVEISDPMMMIYAERFYAKENCARLSAELKAQQERLKMAEHAVKIAGGDKPKKKRNKAPQEATK